MYYVVAIVLSSPVTSLIISTVLIRELSYQTYEEFPCCQPYLISLPDIMAEENNDPLPDTEKVRIATDFIIHAPPGEFNEVFNDVRVLLNNDNLLKDGAGSAFSQYNKDQLPPVEVEGSELASLITNHNDLGGGRFADARSKQSFKFDHLRQVASDYQSFTPDEELEGLRAAVEAEVTDYCLNHYKAGVCAIFSKEENDSKAIVCCIENHRFEPTNFWNGGWRSQWTMLISDKQSEVRGELRVHAHSFEEGNIQLVSSKEVKNSIMMGSDEDVAKELVGIMKQAENEYQNGISENYQTMNDTTFKALRRQLPVTRTKVDWNKITSYSIGKQLTSN